MSYGQHLTSGALSGFASAICLQPFDLLKTRIQQGEGVSKPVRLARHVITTDGFFGLWRGTLPTLVRNVPGVALYMSTLQQIRKAMTSTSYFINNSRQSSSSSVLPSLTVQGNLLAGAAARGLIGVILNPLAILKARYESDLYSYRSVWGGFRSLLGSGPSQLFRGAAASAMRDAPYAGLFMVVYEQLKSEATFFMYPASGASSALIHAVAGAGAGTTATLITHPFDVLKTKLQVRNEKRYSNLRTAIVTIWTTRGATGFFDGVTLRLSRKVLSSAIGWTVYEGFLLFIHKKT